VHQNFDSIVRGGRFLSRGMPAFREILSEKDVSDLHAFVRSSAQARPAP
jgi:mono/diheme cytochrome c family protein